jgi:hypothetical protein
VPRYEGGERAKYFADDDETDLQVCPPHRAHSEARVVAWAAVLLRRSAAQAFSSCAVRTEAYCGAAPEVQCRAGGRDGWLPAGL